MAKPAVRLRVVEIAFGLGIVGLLAKMVQVQLIRGVDLAAEAEARRTERVVLPGRRGAIFDRSGTPLALTQEVYHVGVAPNELRDQAKDARTIATHLGLSRGQVGRALRRRYAYFHGPFTSSQVQTLTSVRGVHLTGELIRFHPDPDLARAILGRPEAEGRPADGLERSLDSLLAGAPGAAVVIRDGRGRRYESPSRLDAFPRPGHDVTLTIDAELQDIVERALEDAIERFEADGGDIVVIEPESGELLAVASRRADGGAPPSAFTSVFEPGSTAKLFAAAGLLMRSRVGPSDAVKGENGVYRLGRRTIRDEHAEVRLTLRRAVAVSSNIGIVKFASRLTPAELYETLRDFGLGSQTGVEFPAESRGLLPRPHQWSGTSAASLAMGYEVAVTPLQLAQAYAAIAYDGVLLQPTLLKLVRDASGRVVYEHVPAPVRQVVTPEVARELRKMLRDVVYAGGTGTTAALTSDEIAGKTGTARRSGRGGYIPGSYTASFASMFPADRPQLVMVVKLDDPKGVYAGVTAAPVTRAVIEQLLAARSGSLDRAELAGTRTAPRPNPLLDAGTVPHIVAWPTKRTAMPPEPKVVPDVIGMSLRAAVGRLHREGVSVDVRGWGRVVEVHPDPGARVPPGAVVRLVARDGR